MRDCFCYLYHFLHSICFLGHLAWAYGPPGVPADAEHSRKWSMAVPPATFANKWSTAAFSGFGFHPGQWPHGWFPIHRLAWPSLHCQPSTGMRGSMYWGSIWGKKTLQPSSRLWLMLAAHSTVTSTLLCRHTITEAPFSSDAMDQLYPCTKFTVWWSAAKSSFWHYSPPILQDLEVEGIPQQLASSFPVHETCSIAWNYACCGLKRSRALLITLQEHMKN